MAGKDAQPNTAFEWPMYADATLAGLSVLVPVPFLDDVFEGFFRRRMTRTIARGRGVAVPDAVQKEIGAGEGHWLAGCLLLPVRLFLELLKKLSRKLLYFLTIKESSEQLSYYWHRAFLLDYMIASGHLDSVESARIARAAMEQVLEATGTPLTTVARQVISRSHHALRTLRRAREGQEDEEIQQARQEMAARWGEFAQHLEGVARHYDAQRDAIITAAIGPPT